MAPRIPLQYESLPKRRIDSRRSSATEDAALTERRPSYASLVGLELIADDSKHEEPKAYQQALKLCFGAAGIYSCYLVYGHIQEDVFRYRSEQGTRFHHVWFLQVLECLVNILVGCVGRKFFGGRKPQSLLPFLQSGASQVFSKVLTSLSLTAGLSYPVCVLSKSAKMVPVMVGQLVLGGSTYAMRDYLAAGMIVSGTAVLSLGGGGGASSSRVGSTDPAPSFTTASGLLFITLSLVMDGVTGGVQKRLKNDTEGKPPTTYDFLLFTNLAMGLVALTIAMAVGDIVSGMVFLSENPRLQQMIGFNCLLSAMGQSFIFFVVAHFDPMVCATVTTTRKILSVLWSIATKGHIVAAQGHVGLAIAITGVLMGLREKPKKEKPETPTKGEDSLC